MGLGGRDVADGIEEATGVEPVDPVQGSELDGLGAALGLAMGSNGPDAPRSWPFHRSSGTLSESSVGLSRASGAPVRSLPVMVRQAGSVRGRGGNWDPVTV